MDPHERAERINAALLTVAGIAMAQGPRAPAEPNTRAPQAQAEEQRAQRMERKAQQHQLHREEGQAITRERVAKEQQLQRQERQARAQQLQREQLDAISTMTRENRMLREAECGDSDGAAARMTRAQRGPQARW